MSNMISKQAVMDFLHSEDSVFAYQFAKEIRSGRFDLPSNQGEAARLREALEKSQAEVEEWKGYYDKLLQRKERLVAAIQRGEPIHFATLDGQALSSHTEEEYTGPSISSTRLMLDGESQ